jgi:hypothetical protein
VILDMDTSTYFNMMAHLMSGTAPAAREDAPMLVRMRLPKLCPPLGAGTSLQLKTNPL